MNINIDFEDALMQNDYSVATFFINESIEQLKKHLDDADLTSLESDIEQKKSKFSFLVKKKVLEIPWHLVIYQISHMSTILLLQ